MAWSSRPSMPAGHIVTASAMDAILDQIDVLSASPPTSVILASNHAGVTNSTTKVVTNLSLPVAASSRYWLDALLVYQAITAADFGVGLNLPSGATFVISPFSLQSGDTDQVGEGYWGVPTTLTGIVGAGAGVSAGNAMAMHFRGSILTSSTAGNAVITYAQGTSNATATTLLAGSVMTLTPASAV